MPDKQQPAGEPLEPLTLAPGARRWTWESSRTLCACGDDPREEPERHRRCHRIP